MKKMRACRICNMIPREKEEIEQMMRDSIPYGVILKLFMKRMKGIRIGYNSAYQTIKTHHLNHLAQREEEAKEKVAQMGEIVEVGGRVPSWDEYYAEVKKLGLEQIRKNPDKIKPSDVVAAEQANTAKERLKLQTDALQLVAAKFFSGITADNAKREIEKTGRERPDEEGLPPLLQGVSGDNSESDSDEVLGW